MREVRFRDQNTDYVINFLKFMMAGRAMKFIAWGGVKMLNPCYQGVEWVAVLCIFNYNEFIAQCNSEIVWKLYNG